MNKLSEMTSNELFMEVFNREVSPSTGVTMRGTLMYYKGECVFNIDGHRLSYSLYRLGKLLNEIGEFD